MNSFPWDSWYDRTQQLIFCEDEAAAKFPNITLFSRGVYFIIEPKHYLVNSRLDRVNTIIGYFCSTVVIIRKQINYFAM